MLDSFSEFHIPDPTEMVPLAIRDDAEIRLRRYGNPRGARLALSQATDWRSLVTRKPALPLTRQFNVVILILRNHGENARHERSRHQLDVIVEDFEEVFQAIQSFFQPGSDGLVEITPVEIEEKPRWQAFRSKNSRTEWCLIMNGPGPLPRQTICGSRYSP